MKPTAPRIPLPVVAVGADVEMSRPGGGCYGVLLGARRADWIDVVRFVAVSGGLEEAIASRFAAYPSWDAVGLAAPDTRLRSRKATERLLEALVPGDVLLTEKALRFHAGDRWLRVRPTRI